MSVKRPSENLRLLSEEPIEAVWLRIRQIQSVTLAKKLIAERSERENVKLDDKTISTKAEGLAYSLRNASDYFHAGKVHNFSQRILNAYYGSLGFAFAEMLASPNGPKMLSEIEKHTKQEHGLYTIDGKNDEIKNLVVGIISSGFFPIWIKSIGLAIDNIPPKKARDYRELESMPLTSYITLEQLFACIPEVSDLFNSIFDSAPRYVNPVYDINANPRGQRSSEKVYALLIDGSARLKKEDIAQFSRSISEISENISDSGSHFRVAIDCIGKKTWWDALQIHKSYPMHTFYCAKSQPSY